MKHDGPGPRNFLTSKEATSILRVRQQTLYAYVSRGLIRSIGLPGKRSRFYFREDIERMSARSLARSGHGAVAASALFCGEPILATSITEITPEGPRYRGRLAVDMLNQGCSFEMVAELLWTGRLDEDKRWPVHTRKTILKIAESFTTLESSDQILEVFAFAVLQLGVDRGSIAERLWRGRTLESGREIIQTLVGYCGLLGPHACYTPMVRGQSIAEGLIKAMQIRESRENRRAIEAILILLADHELSPGTFAARICASVGGTLQSCVATALCTSSGVEIGRLYNRVSKLVEGARTRSALVNKALDLQARGRTVPGFEHPLYPNGDPRVDIFLRIAQEQSEGSKLLAPIFGFIKEMDERFNLHPRHELAVVVLLKSMGIPGDAGGAIYVIARTAGWIAHVQEQRISGSVIRPRAKFVGVAAPN